MKITDSDNEVQTFVIRHIHSTIGNQEI
jgi:hypothetical protein